MRKLLFVVLAAFTVFSCQKKEGPVAPAEQDLVFGISEIDPSGGLKGSDEWECKDLSIDYAEVEINGTTYFPLVFRLDGKLYTQAIKFLPGSYNVTRFLLKHDTDGDGPEIYSGDDEIVMGTPESTSTYAQYIGTGLTVSRNVTVGEFTKTEIDIEVLCFLEKDYTKFGFQWFALTEIVIREQCFFGDFCVKHPADYDGSDYENQSTGLQIDMPAIFKIMAYKDDVLIPYNDDFTNANDAHGWGVGHAVCVQYPDNLNVDGEEFRFELWIYVRVGSGFDYVKFHEWTFMDAEMITTQNVGEATDDGVVDFVLGNCNLSSTNLQIAPYQNLPTSITMNIQHPGNPGYWNFNVTSVTPAGSYDFSTGPQIGWCGDEGTTIGEGTHTFYVFSSLNPNTWPVNRPAYLADGTRINRVNWMFNNLETLFASGHSITTMTATEGNTLQDAIWFLLHGTGSNTMSAAAATWGNYSPLPGGWAAVLLFKNTGNAPYNAQLLFIQVDP